MYVYVKDNKIFLQSETRKRIPGSQEYITDHKMTDRLIFEGWQVKVYEHSKQYIEDTNRYQLQKELAHERKINKDLTKIANNRIREDMQLDIKKKEPSSYYKNLYLLKKMKWSQHSWWTESGSNYQSYQE